MYNKKTNEYDGIIYCFHNKVNDKKYIGQTMSLMCVRYGQHMYETRKEHPKFPIHKAIKKYGIENFDLQVIENISANSRDELKQLLNDKEQYYIKLYNTTVEGYGYNLTYGGETTYLTAAIPLYQFTHDGIFIKRYESHALAALDMNGDPSNISSLASCAKHKMPQAYGYIWEYTETCDRVYVKPEKDCSFNYKKAKAYTLDGKLVGIFESYKEAAKFADVPSPAISEAIDKENRTAGGYIWRSENKEFSSLVESPIIKKLKKPMNVYTLDNQFVDTFYYGYDVRQFLHTSKSISNIYAVANGKRNEAYGYKWFYSNDHNQPDKSKIITNSQEETKAS